MVPESGKTNAIPRMRLIFPGSTKFSVFTCLTVGHRNCISPPPAGGAPRFFICLNGEQIERSEEELYVPGVQDRLKHQRVVNAAM